jgi:hypothetical protein
MKVATVDFNKGMFQIRCPYWDNGRVKTIPSAKWIKSSRSWEAPAIVPTAREIISQYDQEEITSAAKVAISKINDKVEKSKNEFPLDHQWPSDPPRPHQLKALNRAWGKKYFYFAHAMRAGKSYTAIQWASALAARGEINAVLIIPPSAVGPVWIGSDGQLAKFMTLPHSSHMLRSGQHRKFLDWDAVHRGEGQGPMPCLVIGVEAFSQGNAFKYANHFMKDRKVMVIIDESVSIKNHKSMRTRRVTDICGSAAYIALLNGTPVTQGVQDLYSQFYAMNWSIIGVPNYYSFKNRYLVEREIIIKHGPSSGRSFRTIEGYKNTNELFDLIGPYIDIVTKKQAMPNLPDAVFETRYIEPSKEQRQHIASLKDIFAIETDSGILEVETVLERLLRYQQIAGGFLPIPIGKDDNGDEQYEIKPLNKNPKLDGLLNVIEQIGRDSKTIIWARFRPELSIIKDHLVSNFGEGCCVEYHGGVNSPEERAEAIRRFHKDDNCQFFLSNAQTGGRGLPLQNADSMIYYSNTFSYNDREQSLARGDDNNRSRGILVVDLVLDHEVDKMIIEALATKQSISTFVTTKLAERG